ncbi:LpqB family beta-propeller domain-containing protein [Arthrobacter bambusae]|uniref:LpqB family beta-propeller domain-containing protein n=1 Tax=Arthrobacter bambusae TaxID=1338426 RepID=UPI0027895CB6|nr:LpqB family beta-propeller domain-containing protein [Arthrobacter bambusae]MDQ0212564.1 hypothetical protein [Arthrobacter bambusae]MDQ0236946.1 hypothetical protein [Arthrobacter bambusae]
MSRWRARAAAVTLIVLIAPVALVSDLSQQGIAAYGSESQPSGPVQYGAPTVGNKTAPPEPVDQNGTPVLLTRGPELDSYLAKLAAGLDVAAIPPPTKIGVFGRVMTAASDRLTIRTDPMTASAADARANSVTNWVRPTASTLVIAITGQTVLMPGIAHVSDLAPGTMIFVGGQKSADDIVADLVADVRQLHLAGPPDTPPTTVTPSPPAPATSPLSRVLPDGNPITGTGAELAAFQQQASVSGRTVVQQPPADPTDVGNPDTVTFSGSYGGGIDPHLKATFGDPATCSVEVKAEFFAEAHYEIHWPFQFRFSGDGFTATAIDRNPGPGGSTPIIDANLGLGFDQYSVYSGWGLALGAGISVGCHVGVGPFQADISFDVGTDKINFVWLNQTKAAMPLTGDAPLIIPPDNCPSVSYSIADVVSFGIADCQTQTFTGGLLKATLTGAGGSPQGITMGYGGLDSVSPATAPSGGPVTVDNFGYASGLKVTMTAGLVFGIHLDKLLSKKKGGDKNGPPVAAGSARGVFHSGDRRANQKGPILEDGSWQAKSGKWYDAAGIETRAPPSLTSAIAQANAHWVHTNQRGGTLATGQWLHNDGTWRDPESKITKEPTDAEKAIVTPGTEDGDKSVLQKTKDAEAAVMHAEGDVAKELHGLEYSSDQADLSGEGPDPAALLLNLPVLPAPQPVSPQPPSVSASPPSGRISFVCAFNLCAVNGDGTGTETIVTGTTAPVRSGELSPDGSKVAYSTGTYHGHDIWVADLHPSPNGLHAVDIGAGSAPSWSSDGSRLVFTNDSTVGGISVMNADGTGTRRQVNPTGDKASWSPDGKRIIFIDTSPLGPTSAYSVSADGGSPTMVVSGAKEAVISPDGTRIAFISEHDLGTQGRYWAADVANADGSKVQTLDTPTLADNGDSSLSWSPNGSIILVQRDTLKDANFFIAINADGTGEHQIMAFTKPSDGSSPRWQAPRAP